MKTIIGIGVLLGSFAEADRYVGFGGKNGMVVIGHTLVWHSQTPDWVFKDSDGKPATRELLLGRMEKHIRTVVGSYKGRIRGWDVVNETLADNGDLRNSRWLKIIGENYIVKAFEFAQGSTMGMAIVWDHFINCIEAARLLAIEPDFSKRVPDARSRLLPMQVGARGQFQEWFKDFEVDVSWENGRLVTSQIRSLIGGKCEVRQGDKRVSFELKPGEKLSLASDLKRSESK